METITIGGKKFEKVEVDLDALAVGDKVYIMGTIYLVVAISRNMVCTLDKSTGNMYVKTMPQFQKWFYTLKEIKQPEVIETMWFRCINNIDWDFESENHMYAKGEIVCSETWMMPAGCWQEVKPINESCTMFEVCND